MTTPTPALANQAEQHTHQLRQLADTVTTQATAALTAQLAAAQAAATTAWIAATADLTATPPRPQLARILTDARSRLTTAMAGQDTAAARALTAGAQQATRMGTQQAARFATAASGTPQLPPPTPPVDPDVQQAISQVPAQVREQQQAALQLLTVAATTAAGWAGVAAAFNLARRAVTRIRSAASWILGASAAHGVRAFAEHADTGVPDDGRRPTVLMWVAEPGACPACAAYAGRHIEPGGKFPGGLTLDRARAYFPAPVTGPPRHSHCRCVLVPWRADWAAPGSPLPALLRQRAARPRRP